MLETLEVTFTHFYLLMPNPPSYQLARERFGPGMHRIVPHLDDFLDCLRLVLHDDRKRDQVVRLYDGTQLDKHWRIRYSAAHRMPYATRAPYLNHSTIAFPTSCPQHVRDAITKAATACRC